MFSHQSEQEIYKIIDIPFVPTQVSLAHLDENFRLLSADEVRRVEGLKLATGHHHKQDTQCTYTIIVENGDYYAVYYGKASKLGHGATAKVKLAQHLGSGEWAAVKINYLHINSMAPVEREYTALQKLSLLAPTAYSKEPIYFDYKKKNGHTVNNALGMPFFHGVELHTHLNSLLEMPTLPLLAYVDIAIQLADYLHLLKTNQIIHRDIKPENIIFDLLNLKVHLIDFGVALNEGPYDDESLFGTAGFIAAKRTADDKYHYDYQSDMYALGKTLEEIFKACEDAFPPELDNIHSTILNFIKTIYTANTGEGPSTEAVSNFFRELKNLLTDNNKTLKIGLLNVADANDEDMIAKLDDCHQIWLCDTNSEMTIHDYVKIKHIFERAGYVVSDKIVQGNHEHHRLSAITEILQSKHPEYNFAFQSARPHVHHEQTPTHSYNLRPRK